jgi:hypothetical protein
MRFINKKSFLLEKYTKRLSHTLRNSILEGCGNNCDLGYEWFFSQSILIEHVSPFNHKGLWVFALVG